MRHFLFTALALAALLLPVRLTAQLPGWKGAIYFEVNNGSNAEDLVDYQVKVTFNHKTLVDRGDSRADGGDLRFSDCDGNLLHFWTERGMNTTYTVCWIKIPYQLARSKEILMLSYGKNNTESVENPDSVFDFFDDFSDAGVTTMKWDRSANAQFVNGWIRPYRENMDWGGTNYMYCRKNLSYLNTRGIVECEVRSRKENVGGNVIFYVNDPLSPTHYMIQHDTRSLNNTDGDFGMKSGNYGGEVMPRYVYKWDRDERVFYQLKIISKNNLYQYRISNTSSNRRISGSVYPNTNWNWNHIGLSAMNIADYSFEVNYIWVRKYTPVEPTTYQKDMNVLTSSPGYANFGWLVCENGKDLVLSLKNVGTDPFNVTGYRFSKGPLTRFTFADFDTLNFTAGGTKTVTVSFFSNLPGRYEDTLLLLNDNPCAADLKIPLLAVKDSISVQTGGLVADTLDFGYLCLNEAADTNFTIINKSTVATFITGSQLDTIFLFKGNNPFLDPMDINEERKVAVTFSGSPAEGIFYDSLSVIDTCGRVKKVYFKVSVGEPAFELSQQSVDFGDVILPCDSVKTLSFGIINKSPYSIPGIVNSVTLKGQFGSGSVARTDLNVQDTIAADSSRTVTITFQPLKQGQYDGELLVSIDPCDIQKIVNLKANVLYTRFEGQRDGVDFGQVRINSFRDSTIIFENTGTASLTVNDLSGISTPFEVISTMPPLPATLGPGDSIRVLTRFNSTDTLEHSCNLSLSGEPCSFADRVLLKGKGLPIIADALIYIPNTFGKAGEKIAIPLILESSNNLIQSGIDAFEAVVTMNRTLLKPVSIADSCVTLAGDTREVRLYGVWNSPNGILCNMEFIPALGDSVCTDMKISSFKWLNGLSNVNLIDGRFCLVDVCYEGGARLFDDDNKLTLSVSPVPSGETINVVYGVIEEGDTKLILYDCLGNEAARLDEGPRKAGTYSVEYGTAALSQGIYQLSLVTPTQVVTRLVQVVK